MTFTPLFSATSDGTFEPPSPAYAVSVSAPAGAAETAASGEELCTFLLPDSDKEYCKIKIATTGACTGSLDVAMRVWMPDGTLVADPSNTAQPLVVVTPFAAADLSALHFAQDGDVIYFAHPSYAPCKLSRYADTSCGVRYYRS